MSLYSKQIFIEISVGENLFLESNRPMFIVEAESYFRPTTFV